MNNEDQEFWKSLLSNRSLRSRFIRDLELQSIASESTEDLLHNRHDEELMPGRAAFSRHKVASKPSW